jgi:CIC family chloride channel protein
VPGSDRWRSVVARLSESRTRWIVFGLCTGVCSGLVAVLFFMALEAASFLTFNVLAATPQPAPPGEHWIDAPAPVDDPRRWVFFLLPVAGGLISGVLVYRFAPEAEGPGTDAMIKAFHEERGRIRPQAAVIKGLATVATLATGGSAGKEGPIAQIGAGIGSFLATRLGLSARDRRILLLAGTAGGLGAIFRAPLGSAITAIEVLYLEDFESDALIPCVISSVTAYVIFVTFMGGARIFAVPDIPLAQPIELPGYLLLALITVPVGLSFIRLYYFLRDRCFARLPGPRALMPMLGGLGVGVIGLWFPQVYGAGWGYIQQALNGEIVLQTMLLILFAKIAATSLTIASGGSGGVFGPMLFMGGMLGGVIGYGGNMFLPAIFPHPEAYVLVGMASFFAGVASAPIGAMLMVAEMTGGYALLPPLMLVSVVSIVLMRHRSIYENQVRDRFRSPAHVQDLTINVLEEMRVGDVYRPSDSVPSVRPGTGFQRVRELILEAHHPTVPVVNDDGAVVGLVTAEQIRPIMDEHQLARLVVARDIAAPPYSLLPDDDLYRAHELFRASGCPQIPVVGEEHDDEVPAIIGMIDYRELMQAYHRELSRRRDH